MGHQKSQKITFVGKNRFSTDWPGLAGMMIYGRKCVLWTQKNILQAYFHIYLILKHIWKKSKKIDFWLWIFLVVDMQKSKNTVLVTKRHKKCCHHDFTHMNSLPHQYGSLSRTHLSPIIFFVSRPLEAKNRLFYENTVLDAKRHQKLKKILKSESPRSQLSNAQKII